MLALAMLFSALLAGLLLVPLGLPGLWVMLGATLVYWLAVPAGEIGLVTLLVASALVVIAEVLEFTSALVAGRPPAPDLLEAELALGAVLALYESARTGQPVRLAEFLAPATAG